MPAVDGLLAALGLFKVLDPRISVNEVIVFLRVAEAEGLTVQAVAQAAGLTQSTASRSLRALGPAGSPWSQAPAVGLLEAYLKPDDARSHVICLSPAGRDLRERLNGALRGEPAASRAAWRANREAEE